MDDSVARLDLTQVFCDLDDFCQALNGLGVGVPALPYEGKTKVYRSQLSLSEVTTIVIGFHGSGFRTFKEFYTLQVLPHWRNAFPHLVSYTRFVELMPWSLMVLVYLLKASMGEQTGISFVDSTALKVCHPNRAPRHKVFKNVAQWGKTSTGWFFGFKLHLIINDRGELLAVDLTPGNVDDRTPLSRMSQGLLGKLFGDRGYISKALFEKLYDRGLHLITRLRKNMKNVLVNLLDKILLRKRAVVESVIDQLKNICQIEHSRHRSRFNFLVNLLAGLVAYSYHPTKPALNLHPKELAQLPDAMF